MGGSSNAAPVAFGVHAAIVRPFGTYTTPKRFTGFAEVFTVAVSAGTMASSRGSAIAVPTPRRNVRRGIESFEIYMTVFLLSSCSYRTAPPAEGVAAATLASSVARTVRMTNGVLVTMPVMMDDHR